MIAPNEPLPRCDNCELWQELNPPLGHCPVLDRETLRQNYCRFHEPLTKPPAPPAGTPAAGREGN